MLCDNLKNQAQEVGMCLRVDAVVAGDVEYQCSFDVLWRVQATSIDVYNRVVLSGIFLRALVDPPMRKHASLSSNIL